MRVISSCHYNHRFASGIVSIVGQRLVLDLRGYDSGTRVGKLEPPSTAYTSNGATMVFGGMQLAEDDNAGDVEMRRMESLGSSFSEVVFIQQSPRKREPREKLSREQKKEEEGEIEADKLV